MKDSHINKYDNSSLSMEVTFYSEKKYISQLLDTFSEVKPYKIDL